MASIINLMMEAKRSSETSFLTRATRRHILEDDIHNTTVLLEPWNGP
jgi:hypothetical protein